MAPSLHDAPDSEHLKADGELRRRVTESPAFQSWMAGLPSVVVDNQKLYVRGGDMLRDEDQIIIEWARREGLLDSHRALSSKQPDQLSASSDESEERVGNGPTDEGEEHA